VLKSTTEEEEEEKEKEDENEKKFSNGTSDAALFN